ncbi:chromate efflux transporter [Leptospira idonii]|uniref:Chromate efflux transporter n=1 Tax=Leptospira idonii TaxID=1193500 RepID=A0A4R9M7T2_9LEPT|nr:chromate efflux transporter [Leptospira idonii]TGN20648.1 chromate efflux transporter [Leptospira idonii]
MQKIDSSSSAFKEIILSFLKLGLTSFGGPIAHIGYFHHEFVIKKKWIDEKTFVELTALCQFLPGPASSQLGMAIGYIRGKFWGSLIAWLLFTLPSAILMLAVYIGISGFANDKTEFIIQGLQIAAVTIVLHAVANMAIRFSNTAAKASISVFTMVACILIPFTFLQVILILLSGILGKFIFTEAESADANTANASVKIPKSSIVMFVLFFMLLLLLPIFSRIYENTSLSIFESFYTAGSLVFGGGHVVLPFLESEVVSRFGVSQDVFMAGYGAAQAVPGPLFAFSSYLGAAVTKEYMYLHSSLALTAIFLPSFLLILAALPVWEKWKSYAFMKSAMIAINACVVGILAAALYQPIWSHSIRNKEDFSLMVLLFLALQFWKLPSWSVIILAVGVKTAFHFIS